MKNNVPDFSGVIAEQTDSTIRHIIGGITSDLKAQLADNENRQASHSLDMAQSKHKQAAIILKAVKEIQPAIEKAVIYSMQQIIKNMEKAESLGPLMKMVNEIPDYSKQFVSLNKAISANKLPKTDLVPIMSQLNTISEQIIDTDERPKSWTFEVIRDERTKLIDRVEVTHEI